MGQREQNHLGVGLDQGRFVSKVQQLLPDERLLRLGVWRLPPGENENEHNTSTCVEPVNRGQGEEQGPGLLPTCFFFSSTVHWDRYHPKTSSLLPARPSFSLPISVLPIPLPFFFFLSFHSC